MCAGEAVAVVECATAGLSTVEFVSVEGSLARQYLLGLCALEGECQHEANDCDDYSLKSFVICHFYCL